MSATAGAIAGAFAGVVTDADAIALPREEEASAAIVAATNAAINDFSNLLNEIQGLEFTTVSAN